MNDLGGGVRGERMVKKEYSKIPSRHDVRDLSLSTAVVSW